MYSIRLSCSLALVAITAFGASSAHAGTLYVNANASTGANDGSSWSDAFQGSSGLQSALAIATSGDQIWVAQGTYLPTSTGNRSISFLLKTGVAMYGGFAGGETNLSQRDVVAHVTILSGDLNGDDASNQLGDNSYHVVNGNSAATSARLDGFTVRGGNANGPILDLTIGGGLRMLNNSNATIAHCIISGCHAISEGGGAYIDDSLPTFIDSRFESNVCDGLGGACLALSGIFSRCVFAGNSAHAGGAVFGFAAKFWSCLFYGNTATMGGGGAIWAADSQIYNCTVVGNASLTAPTGGIADLNFSSVVANSIVYFNTGTGGSTTMNQVGADSDGLIIWSCVQGGTPGHGNISADPHFTDAGAGDFRLSLSSPCIDAGNNTLVPAGTPLDLDLHPRVIDDPGAVDTGYGTAPFVDMGAYESPNILYSSFCAGDATLATRCPCGNFGQTGHGCANSDTLTVGALQTATGAASLDTVVLTASDLLPSVLCIFLQGDAQSSNGVVFGDGVRCVAGHMLRLAAKHAADGLVSYPTTGELSITARSAQLGQPIASGSVRYYQTYYRDPALDFCPAPQGDSWNVTNAIAVQW